MTPFRYLLIASFFFLTQFATAQQYSRVKIDIRNTNLEVLADLGLEVEHGHHVPHRYFTNELQDREIALLEEHNIPFQIVVEDVKQWYKDQNTLVTEYREGCDGDGVTTSLVDKYETPVNYAFGSMGGYVTYEEMLATFQKMHELYPNKISDLIEVPGITTAEGRPMHYVRLSDNPDLDEDEPEILYTALHHAREPNSLSSTIFYIWYVLENSDTDPMYQFLLNETEMYFMPCVNPDGYVYNETTDPEGGGLWRKNRSRDANGNIVGVDLNRNYGHFWAYDDNGSSPNPSSDTYRGTGPFSEPETQAVKWLCDQHDFKIALNCHTFSNLLIHPWGYNDEITEDDPIFKGMGRTMVDENNYKIGTGLETVGYFVNGDSDDWMYAESDEKGKIFAMTPEVGPQEFFFWPPSASIDLLNKEALLMNTRASNLMHYYIKPVIQPLLALDELAGTFSIDLQRFGLQDGSAQVSIRTTNTNMSLAEVAYPVALEMLGTEQVDFSYSYTPDSEIAKDNITIYIDIAYDEGYTVIDSFTRIYDNSDYLNAYTDNGDNLDAWTTESNNNGNIWSQTEEDFISTPYAYTDSPNQEYNPGTRSSFISDTIDLSNATTAEVAFWGKWEIENDYDYAQLRVIDADGNTTPICGLYTNLGTSNQDNGEPLYDDVSSWVLEESDITDYVGQKIQIEFYFRSDNFVEGDGFYFDDLIVRADGIVSNAIDFNQQNIVLSASPNPAYQDLTIDYKAMGKTAKLVIINAIGQQVYSEHLSSQEGSTTIDISGYENGMYQVRLLGDNLKHLKSLKWVKL